MNIARITSDFKIDLIKGENRLIFEITIHWVTIIELLFWYTKNRDVIYDAEEDQESEVKDNYKELGERFQRYVYRGGGGEKSLIFSPLFCYLLVFPARNRAFETSLRDDLLMRALLSKHKEPSLYQSMGNYFSHVLRSNLPTPEEHPKVHFSKLEFQRMRHTFPVRLQRVFILFARNLARMLLDNVAKKPCRGIFIFGLLQKLWLCKQR